MARKFVASVAGKGTAIEEGEDVTTKAEETLYNFLGLENSLYPNV